MRYVGAKNGSIRMASSAAMKVSDPNIEVVKVPDELEHVTAHDLMTGFRVHSGTLRKRRATVSSSELKLAFVGNWKMQCGISTYAESLLPEIVKRIGGVRLFIEKNDQPTSPLNVVGDATLLDEDVVQCWKRGEPLGELIGAIRDYDPDVIFIQHEFGLWSNAGHWLAMMSQLSDYRVIVTLHSVFHHLDKSIVEACIPEIIVHLEGAKRLLREEKGITAPIHVMPHGCSPPLNTGPLWNFYKSNATLVMWGFGFRYKNWEAAIRTTAILKKKHPDVFFTGLFSESPFNLVDHQVYHDELMALVDELGVQDNVAIIRSYQSDQSLDSYLRTNKVALFPYVSDPQHEVFGASGAARYAMTKGLPIITSNANHFNDLPTLKGDTPEELAAVIDVMFSDRKARDAQVSKQLKFINENTWAKVAERHIKIFCG